MTMRASMLGLGVAVVLGGGGLGACGEGGPEGPVALEVQMLSVSGVLDGNTLEDPGYTVTHGERLGDHGSFFLDGPLSSLQVSACPIGNSEANPYEGLPGSEVLPGDPSVEPPPDGIVPTESPRPGTGSCEDRSIFVCDGHGCGSFSTDEVELEIRDEGGWRRLTLDGANATGAVQVELLYRERH